MFYGHQKNLSFKKGNHNEKECIWIFLPWAIQNIYLRQLKLGQALRFQSILHWIRHSIFFGPRNWKLDNFSCILCFINRFCASVVTAFKKEMTVLCSKGINQECIINYDNTATNINTYCNIFCLAGGVLYISSAEKK